MSTQQNRSGSWYPRPVHEHRTPASLIRLTAALAGAAANEVSAEYRPFSAGSAASRLNAAAGSPASARFTLNEERSPTPSPARRKLAFEDPTASDASYAVSTESMSPVAETASPSRFARAANPLPVGSPLSLRNTPVKLKYHSDVSTYVLSDEKVVALQLTSMVTSETQYRERIEQEEDLTFSSRIKRRHVDELEAFRAAARAASLEQEQAASTKKFSAPHPYPYDNGTTTTVPESKYSNDTTVGDDLSLDSFSNAHYAQRFDLHLLEQQLRRRVAVRERLERDVLDSDKSSIEDLFFVAATQELERARITASETVERNDRLVLQLVAFENVTRGKLTSEESDSFEHKLLDSLLRFRARDALFVAYEKKRREMKAELDDFFEVLGRDLYEPFVSQWVQREARERVMILREEISDREFTLSTMVVEDLETVTREHGVAVESKERSAIAHREPKDRAVAIVSAGESQGRAMLLEDASRAFDAASNKLFLHRRQDLEAREKTDRSAVHAKESTDVAPLQRKVWLLNKEAPVAKLFESCVTVLLNRHYKIWRRAVEYRKRTRSIIGMRLRKMSTTNSKIHIRRFFDLWSAFSQRATVVKKLLGNTDKGLLRLRFRAWRTSKVNRLSSAAEADARRVVQNEERLAREAFETKRFQMAERQRLADAETTARDAILQLRARDADEMTSEITTLRVVYTEGAEVDRRAIIEVVEGVEAAVLCRTSHVVGAFARLGELTDRNVRRTLNRFFSCWSSFLRVRMRQRQVRGSKAKRLSVVNARVLARRYFRYLARHRANSKAMKYLLEKSATSLQQRRFTAWQFVRLTRLEQRKTRVAALESQKKQLLADAAEERNILERSEALEYKSLRRSTHGQRVAVRYQRHASAIEMIKTTAERTMQRIALAKWRRFFTRRIQMYRQNAVMMPGLAQLLKLEDSSAEDDA